MSDHEQSIPFKSYENLIEILQNLCNEELKKKNLITFKHWLARESCIDYKNDIGYIDKEHHMTEVDIMFKKTIKLLIANISNEIFLFTKDGEKYVWYDTTAITFNTEFDDEVEDVLPATDDEDWILADPRETSHYIHYTSHKMDWSNIRIVKATTNEFNFLALTDDGKIYYKKVTGYIKKIRDIYEIDIKEKVSCMGCGKNFCVVVTDNCKTYSWGINMSGELGFGIPTLDEVSYIVKPCQVTEFSGKTIVKIVCGIEHTLALTDTGKVYGWGSNVVQLNPDNIDNVSSPVMINIANVKQVSDIAVIDYKSFVKSSKGGLVYIWGHIAYIRPKKPAVCEYTNVFDISNSLMGQSPISVTSECMDEGFHILNDLEAAFNDQSTSDLMIMVEKQSIYVHKAILKIRSRYFRSMFLTNYIENRQSLIENNHHKYVVYKKFLEYLYTGRINMSSFENLLDLLRLADEFCEEDLQMDCIRAIKKTINVSNVMGLFKIINEMTVEHHKKELIKYCFNFYLKNMTDVIQTESYGELDVETKSILIEKGNNFFLSKISSSGYLE